MFQDGSRGPILRGRDWTQNRPLREESGLSVSGSSRASSFYEGSGEGGTGQVGIVCRRSDRTREFYVENNFHLRTPFLKRRVYEV